MTKKEKDQDEWTIFLKEVTPLKKGMKKEEKEHRDKPLKKISLKRRREAQGEFIKTLDLHGVTLEEAYALLEDYLKVARHLKIYNVKVVTGKGSTPRDVPYAQTLYEKVPRWLTEGPLKGFVKKIDPVMTRAQKPQGAFIVILKE